MNNQKKTKYKELLSISLDIIKSFPISKNGQYFLRLQNGRKLFFNIFIKKFGLDNTKNKYNELDVLRRVRLIEFFMYFTKEFSISRKEIRQKKRTYIIESKFYRMVILDIRDKRNSSKLELLSFYHFQ